MFTDGATQDSFPPATSCRRRPVAIARRLLDPKRRRRTEADRRSRAHTIDRGPDLPTTTVLYNDRPAGRPPHLIRFDPSARAPTFRLTGTNSRRRRWQNSVALDDDRMAPSAIRFDCGGRRKMYHRRQQILVGRLCRLVWPRTSNDDDNNYEFRMSGGVVVVCARRLRVVVCRRRRRRRRPLAVSGGTDSICSIGGGLWGRRRRGGRRSIDEQTWRLMRPRH